MRVFSRGLNDLARKRIWRSAVLSKIGLVPTATRSKTDTYSMWK